MRADPPLLEVRDRVELRAWLEANHATATAVRLAIGNKGGTTTSLTYDEAVEEGLAFGWIDSTTRTLDADRHTVLFSRRRPNSTWAASNKRRVERLMAAGLMRPAGIAAVETAKANGSWNSLDESEALVMPADLLAVLSAHEGGSLRWDDAPASQRKIALYWIGTAKRPETRARRIAAVVNAALAGRPLTT